MMLGPTVGIGVLVGKGVLVGNGALVGVNVGYSTAVGNTSGSAGGFGPKQQYRHMPKKAAIDPVMSLFFLFRLFFNSSVFISRSSLVLVEGGLGMVSTSGL